jgi:hypothetical protein
MEYESYATADSPASGLGGTFKGKVEASRFTMAKVKVKARAKANLRVKASPTSHMPYGKE